MEEIVVTSKRSLRALRRETQRATEHLYGLLNDKLGRDFQTTCEREVPLGTKIAERVCRTRFQREELARYARAQKSGGLYEPAAMIAHKDRQMAEAIAGAIDTDPEIKAATLEVERLEQALAAGADARRRERSED